MAKKTPSKATAASRSDDRGGASRTEVLVWSLGALLVGGLVAIGSLIWAVTRQGIDITAWLETDQWADSLADSLPQTLTGALDVDVARVQLFWDVTEQRPKIILTGVHITTTAPNTADGAQAARAATGATAASPFGPLTVTATTTTINLSLTQSLDLLFGQTAQAALSTVTLEDVRLITGHTASGETTALAPLLSPALLDDLPTLWGYGRAQGETNILPFTLPIALSELVIRNAIWEHNGQERAILTHLTLQPERAIELAFELALHDPAGETRLEVTSGRVGAQAGTSPALTGHWYQGIDRYPFQLTWQEGLTLAIEDLTLMRVIETLAHIPDFAAMTTPLVDDLADDLSNDPLGAAVYTLTLTAPRAAQVSPDRPFAQVSGQLIPAESDADENPAPTLRASWHPPTTTDQDHRLDFSITQVGTFAALDRVANRFLSPAIPWPEGSMTATGEVRWQAGTGPDLKLALKGESLRVHLPDGQRLDEVTITAHILWPERGSSALNSPQPRAPQITAQVRHREGSLDLTARRDTNAGETGWDLVIDAHAINLLPFLAPYSPAAIELSTIALPRAELRARFDAGGALSDVTLAAPFDAQLRLNQGLSVLSRHGAVAVALSGMLFADETGLRLDIDQGRLDTMEIKTARIRLRAEPAETQAVQQTRYLFDFESNLAGDLDDIHHLVLLPVGPVRALWESLKGTYDADLSASGYIENQRLLLQDDRLLINVTAPHLPLAWDGDDLDDLSLRIDRRAHGTQVSGTGSLGDVPLHFSYARVDSSPARTYHASVTLPSLPAESLRPLGLEKWGMSLDDTVLDVTIDLFGDTSGQIEGNLLAETINEINVPEWHYRKPAGQPAHVRLGFSLDGQTLLALPHLELETPALTLRGHAERENHNPNEPARWTVLFDGDIPGLSEYDGRVQMSTNGLSLIDLHIHRLESDFMVSPLTEERARLPDLLHALILKQQQALAQTTITVLVDKIGQSQRSPIEDFTLVASYDKGYLTRADLTAQTHGQSLIQDSLLTFLVDREPGAANFSFTGSVSNIGATLHALTDVGRFEDGAMTLTGAGTTTEQATHWRAEMAAEDLVIKDFPFLFHLLSSITSLNLIEPFVASGAVMTQSRAELVYDAGRLRIENGLTQSPALGITFAGEIASPRTDWDMRGTITPAYTLNRIIGVIPFLGDLATGGQEQGVLSFVYRVDGPLGAADLTVNPFSALFPGFLRQWLFTPPPPPAPATQEQ
ncbi:MAG: hypothetical protein AAF442_08920 [Pseudomonadota bacterium]